MLVGLTMAAVKFRVADLAVALIVTILRTPPPAPSSHPGHENLVAHQSSNRNAAADLPDQYHGDVELRKSSRHKPRSEGM